MPASLAIIQTVSRCSCAIESRATQFDTPDGLMPQRSPTRRGPPRRSIRARVVSMGKAYSHHVLLCNTGDTSCAIFPLRASNLPMAHLPASKLQVVMGARLRRLREAKGLSQATIADVIDAAENTISSYERGRTKIDIIALSRICEYFGISTDYIVLGVLGILPFDIAHAIQQAERAELGETTTKRARGRPPKTITPTLNEIAEPGLRQPKPTLHDPATRYLPPPKIT